MKDVKDVFPAAGSPGFAAAKAAADRDQATMMAAMAAKPGIAKDPKALVAECRKIDPDYGKGFEALSDVMKPAIARQAEGYGLRKKGGGA